MTFMSWLYRVINQSQPNPEFTVSKTQWVPLVASLAATLLMTTPVAAQVAPGQPERGGTTTTTGNPIGDEVAAPVVRGSMTRIGRGNAANNSNARRGRNQPPAPPSAEAVRASAQAQVSAAGLTCELTEAINPGKVGEADVYEVACANAPGYIILASTPAQTFDCIELAGTAAIARAANPAADVGQQCSLPANQNGLQVMSQWAQSAGVTCTIDQAQAVGKNNGNMVYEIGCADTDGYWMDKAGSSFTLTPCVKVTSQGGTCRFTTTQEISSTFQAKLAGTPAAGCAVTQVRLMGSNANGEFYEAKCAAEGEGYIARVNTQGVTQQVYPCAAAQSIGGGCTLTTTAPAAAPATEQ